jgi:carbon monoxide dehydrogenase subunit G
MASFHFTKSVKADTAKTFEVFSDLRNADQRISGIKKLEVLSDGPIGKGTRFRESRVMMFGRESSEVMEITDFQPGRSYTVGSNSCGSVFSTTYQFKPEAGGTRVEMDMNIRPVSLFAKLTSPLMTLFAGTLKKWIESDLNDLVRYLQSGKVN